MRPMETQALERPADLTIWRTAPVPAPLAQPARYRTLREAIEAAAGALSDPAKPPVTHPGGRWGAPADRAPPLPKRGRPDGAPPRPPRLASRPSQTARPA